MRASLKMKLLQAVVLGSAGTLQDELFQVANLDDVILGIVGPREDASVISRFDGDVLHVL